jgi:hypothetical protein
MVLGGMQDSVQVKNHFFQPHKNLVAEGRVVGSRNNRNYAVMKEGGAEGTKGG